MPRLVTALLFAAAACAEIRTGERQLAAGRHRVASPFPFSAVALRWNAGDDLRILAGGEWKQPAPDPDGLSNSALVWTGEGSAALELIAAGPVRLLFIDPGRTPEEQRRKIRERAAGPDKPAVVSRLDWNCPDGNLSRGPFVYTTVTHLIVHHTGDSFPSNDYPAWIRAIWAYHVFSNGWIDIGYNYLVDPEGTIYEGRAGGDNVLGAHFSCQNGGTMGVSLLGTFSTVAPNDAAVSSLERLLAWKAGRLGMDPLGRTLHRGTGTVLDNISGHRDGNHIPGSCTVTECPGEVLYGRLPGIRQQVAALTSGLLSMDAESGPGGWTASGLWHISARRAAGGSHAWWYGREDSGSYDTPGQANSGTLESPAFDLAAGAVLSFRSWYETEDTGPLFDRKLVEISVDGGAWQPLLAVTDTWREWTTVTAPLGVRGPVRLRFRFDTVDAAFNGFEGWYVDEISVRQVSP